MRARILERQMVSASILPTKGRATVAPDQLQALPFKVFSRVSPNQLRIVTAIGKPDSQPTQVRQDDAAGQEGQRLGVAARPMTGDFAVGSESYAPQSCRPTHEPPEFAQALAEPRERQ